MSAIGMASLGTQCGNKALGIASLGVICVSITIEQSGQAPVYIEVELDDLVCIAAKLGDSVQKKVKLLMTNPTMTNGVQSQTFLVGSEQVFHVNAALERFDVKLDAGLGAQITFKVRLLRENEQGGC